MKNMGKHIISYTEDRLTIIDPLNYEVLKDEKFACHFLSNFSHGKNGNQEKSNDFGLLFQNENRIEIKECGSKSAQELFDIYCKQNEIDEAMKILFENKKIWTENNLDKIFENEEKLKEKSVLNDPKLRQIIVKVIKLFFNSQILVA